MAIDHQKVYAYLPREVEWMKDLVRFQFGMEATVWNSTWQAVVYDAQKKYRVMEVKIVDAQEELKYLAFYRIERRKQLKTAIAKLKKDRVRFMRREYIGLLLLAPELTTTPPDEVMDLDTYGADVI